VAISNPPNNDSPPPPLSLPRLSFRAPNRILRRHAEENETEELSLRRSRRRLWQSPTTRSKRTVHFLRMSPSGPTWQSPAPRTRTRLPLRSLSHARHSDRAKPVPKERAEESIQTCRCEPPRLAPPPVGGAETQSRPVRTDLVEVSIAEGQKRTRASRHSDRAKPVPKGRAEESIQGQTRDSHEWWSVKADVGLFRNYWRLHVPIDEITSKGSSCFVLRQEQYIPIHKN